MFLSIFDVFKIGVGPSSSHTMGPMVAAAAFLDALAQTPQSTQAVAHIQCRLHGSLAFTGKGHATDRAVALGLLGWHPADLDSQAAERQLAVLHAEKRLMLRPATDSPPLDVAVAVAFDPETDIVFDYGPPLEGHANALVLTASDAQGATVLRETYYSIGGGFVVTADELADPPTSAQTMTDWPFPFENAATMLRMADASGLSIADMKRRNEACMRAPEDVDAAILTIWQVMNDCIERGLAQEGTLPGGLHVQRRARKIHHRLIAARQTNRLQPHAASDWLSVYAMAVNEENAAGGRIVTAPTNGAAGVIPSVLRYYLDHCVGADPALIPDFLLTAAAIGGLIKHNASISGAEVGCQGEVGSAAAMAAAGLCAVLGGSPRQVENAAEIALEHHLGMTCDPAAGLVQVPCIERNGIGATKAVAAASLALHGDGSHFMPLDNCIQAMRQTGEDMNTKFKETSLGGLAVNLPEC